MSTLAKESSSVWEKQLALINTNTAVMSNFNFGEFCIYKYNVFWVLALEGSTYVPYSHEWRAASTWCFMGSWLLICFGKFLELLVEGKFS